MAGDLATFEEVLLRPRGLDSEIFRSAVTGFRVLHEYGDRLRLASADADEAFRSVRAAFPDADIGGLDRDGQLGLEAFALRSSSSFRDLAESRPLNGRQWDFDGPMFAPDPPSGGEPDGAPDDADETGSSQTAGTVTSVTPMSGRIAFGMVVVSGPTSALRFTPDEVLLLTAQVQNGLTWLGTQSAGAQITWVHDINLIDIVPSATPVGGNYEELEATFRDPALAGMGHPVGVAGVASVLDDLRTRKSCASAILVFFTKYPTGHFAYAWPNAGYLVMTYQNDGWGSNTIDRVLAHRPATSSALQTNMARVDARAAAVGAPRKGRMATARIAMRRQPRCASCA